MATRLVIGHAVKSTPSKVEDEGEAVVMRTLIKYERHQYLSKGDRLQTSKHQQGTLVD